MALFLALTIAATAIVLPTANAHTPAETVPTWCYIVVSPNPIGINQPVIVFAWLDKVPATANGAYGDRWTYTVQVTKPDNTSETLGPVTSDPDGSAYLRYTPTAVGTYYFQAFFPDTVLAGVNPIPGGNAYSASPYVNDTYLASTSDKVPLTVQQEPIMAMPSTPLPTSYWTRPIYAANSAWSCIAGNWLNDGISNNRAMLNTAGPDTAHIVWTKTLDFGGVVGQQYGNGQPSDLSYYTGSMYETKLTGAVIMQGRLYYNAPKSDQPSTGGLMCVDLRTGQEYWWDNNTRVSMGEIYDYESPNQHGPIPYLVQNSGTTSDYIDPFSGQWLYTITNVPSGIAAVGPSGERLIYVVDLTHGWMACWNDTAIPQLLLGNESGTNMWQWRPVGKTVNGINGYSWNVTIPKDLPPRQGRDFANVVYDGNAPEMLLCSSGFVDRWTTTDPYTLYAISLKPGQEGQLLWRKSYSPPFPNATIDPGYGMVIDSVNRVFCLPVTQMRQWYGYSLDTGAQLWGPTPSQTDFDYYRMLPISVAVNGIFYAGGYGGIVYAYNITTGKLLWTSPLGNTGLEAPYQYWPIGCGSDKTYADGKLYISTNEHSNTQPLYRGWSIYCINASTGEGIWNITGLMGTIAVADGYAVGLDSMDNQIYCYGKGPSATTVSAPQTAITEGQSAVITGTVTDQSPGAMGTPVISDNDMTAWMEYLYHQSTMPTNAKGVEVTLDAIDPNGNFVHLGTATSDASGNFGYAWATPNVPGKYTIIATFAGSNSYGASYAETYAVVSEAPATTPLTQTTTQESPMLTYLLAAAIVIIILAIAAIVLLLRRK
jgi:hypothetical protein